MRKNLFAELSLMTVAALWGATFLPVQNVIKIIDVPSFLFWRFLVAFIFTGAVLRKSINFKTSTMLSGLMLGFLLYFAFIVQTFALKFTYSSFVAFLTGVNVLIVPFLMFVIFRQKVSIYAFFGSIFALVGMYFLNSFDNQFALGWGEILALLSALGYALHIAFTSIFTKNHNVNSLVFYQFFGVCVFAFFTAIFFGEKSPNNVFLNLSFSLEPQFLINLVVMGIFATSVAFFVQTWAQKFTTPTKTALILTLEPVSAGVVGYFYGSELLTGSQLLGSFLIIFGVLFSEVGSNLFEKIKNRKSHK